MKDFMFKLLLTVVVMAVSAANSLRHNKNNHRALRGASFCYEDFDPAGDDCWGNRPTNLPNCTLNLAIEQPNAPCFFTDNNGDFESNDLKDPNFTVAICNSAVYYVREDDEYESRVCKEYDVRDEWQEAGKVGTAEVACSASPGWQKAACCFFTRGFSYHDGVCSETKKYLGDECGDEWGICNNDNAEAYFPYRLSCYQKENTPTPKCYPTSTPMEKHECKCSFIPFVFCNTNDCNGHACVLHTGDGKYYCDYGTGNNW